MSFLHKFKSDISSIELPKKFTFPFYYTPHPLVELAAEEIQMYLESQSDFKHNFGLSQNNDTTAVGKMFGILVVKNSNNKIGFLAAFSGKLADKSLPEYFVPPIFNTHGKDSFYPKEEIKINAIHTQIETLESSAQYVSLLKAVEMKKKSVSESLSIEKQKLKLFKKERKIRRINAKETLNANELMLFNKKLEQEIINEQFQFNEYANYLNEDLVNETKKLEVIRAKILQLKNSRKQKSGILQEKVFESYKFLNQFHEIKNLRDIFPNYLDKKPPAGSGDCSAPKLLQYAFENNLKVLAMGEFWWGISPSKEIRKHKSFYPSCNSRCKPILSHMLQGIEMEENPFLKESSENTDMDIIYEDESLLIINKPTELLSVPGKLISDSVYTRILSLYPELSGPIIVHRLDMSTSGILVAAKTKEAHKNLQRQFINKSIRKRYVALLDGIIKNDEGEINLPLRVDLDDRPRQLVCNEHGKTARTKYQVIERNNDTTRILFFPITGRTHQLRVHAAHYRGLNTPIVGDDLYGKKGKRLHLHAESIEFQHPLSKKRIYIECEANF